MPLRNTLFNFRGEVYAERPNSFVQECSSMTFDIDRHQPKLADGIGDGIENNAQLNMPVNQFLAKPGDY